VTEVTILWCGYIALALKNALLHCMYMVDREPKLLQLLLIDPDMAWKASWKGVGVRQ
jgi:hypothetical protein